MYCDFYQLTERPFNVTPDPKFLYLNARYREAIASLNYGITQRKGFITLIGEAGTGKTTLLKKLLEDLDPKTKSIFIFNTHVTFEEILEYIFAEFDLPVHNGKKLYMLQRLNTFLLEELRSGGNVALLIDEAQDLEFSVLEDLRLLSNLETAKEKILQIVLSGQPELGQKLSNPILRQLRQRIGINCRLLPLSRDEITEYIRFRLEAAGCPDLKLFNREAEDQIYHFSRGIPRLVNVVCDNALVIGYALGKKRISADVITEAAADLLSVEQQAEPIVEQPVAVAAPAALAPSGSRWRARLGVIAVVLVAVIVGLLSVGRTTLQKHGDEGALASRESPPLEVIRPGSQPLGTGIEQPAEAPPVRLHEPAADVAARPPEAPAARPRDEVAPEPVARTAPVESPRDVALAKLGLPGRPAAGSDPGTAAPAAAAAVAAPEVGAKRDEPMRRDDAAVEDSEAPAGGRVRDEGPTGRAAASRLAAGVPHLDGVDYVEHVVRAGDSMSGIALRQYGQASYTILDLLKVANPQLRDLDVISAGQTIRLPQLSEGFPILNDGANHYALLLFSTPHERRAVALQAALGSRGIEAQVSSAEVGTQKPLYRVVVTGFADRAAGLAVGKRVQQLFRDDARLAQLGE